MNRRWAIEEKLKHWLIILLSPLMLGIIANLIVAWSLQQPIKCWMRWSALVIVFAWIILYLAAYTETFRRPLEAIGARQRASRFCRPRVLILNGSLDGQRPPSMPLYHTDRRPDDWRTALSKVAPS
jgi:hypothetical protein